MATVCLYGHLKEKFGDQFELAVSSPAEAVRALIANFKSFREAVEPGEYSVLVDDQSISEEGLSHSISSNKVIHIMPMVAGAKSGVFQAIAGVVLIAAAVFVPGLQGLAAYAIGGLGVALTMSGMAGMLTPTTNTGEERKAKRIENKYFQSPVNVEAQGRPVPLVYGLREVGSRVISSSRVIE